MGSATRKHRRRELNNLPEREKQRRAADPLERQVFDLSDKIVDLAINNCPAGPGLAITGILEALCRVAATTEVPNIREVLHFQLDALLDDVLPKAAAELKRQAG